MSWWWRWGHATPRATTRHRPAGFGGIKFCQKGTLAFSFGGQTHTRGKDCSRQPMPPYRNFWELDGGNISGPQAKSFLIPSSEKFCFSLIPCRLCSFFKKIKVKHCPTFFLSLSHNTKFLKIYRLKQNKKQQQQKKKTGRQDFLGSRGKTTCLN